jgi:hypothetical protein
MKRYLILLLLVASCINISSNKTSSNLPSWYVKPTNNDQINLYGVGEGFTIQEASKSALNNMASKLAVSISSDSSTVSQENNYSFSEEYRGKVNQKIQEITFNNYKIKNSHRDGINFYTQVQVDRNNFIEDQKALLSQNHKIMKNIYNSSRGKNILIRRNGLIKIKNLTIKSSLINQILKGLRVNSSYDKNLEIYQSYHDSYVKILDQIEFLIQSDNKRIKDIIIKGLNDDNLKVVTLKSKSKNMVIVKVASDRNTKNIYGSNITNLKLKFKLLSGSSKILSSNIIEVTGASVGSEDDSFRASLRALSKKITKDGVMTVIGVDK